MKLQILETVADIAYLAGQYGYYSGNSRDDMQTFISLAEKFEEKYKNVDWEDLPKEHPDYMEAVEYFTIEYLELKSKIDFSYNQAFNKPWNDIKIRHCRLQGDEVYHIQDPKDIEPMDFYSLYAQQIEGDEMCIADVPSEEEANDLRKLILMAVKKYNRI